MARRFSLVVIRSSRTARVVQQTRVTGGLTEVWLQAFDAEGRVTRAVSPTGTIGYEYDALGRKTRTWTSDSVVQAVSDNSLASDTRYEYDALGRLSVLRVFRVAGETLPGTEIQTTRYQYDLEGRLVRQTNPNGSLALHAYDRLGRLTKLTHLAPDATPQDLSNNAKLAEFDDEHSVAGQRTSTTETFWFAGDDEGSDPEPHTSQISWTYDAAGRLVDEVFIRLLRFEARVCVVSQAAAAMLCKHLEDQPVDRLVTFSPRDIPCALLPLEAARLLTAKLPPTDPASAHPTEPHHSPDTPAP